MTNQALKKLREYEQRDVVAVSNSKSLLQCNGGSIIDQYTHVVRFNGAVVGEEFATQVGRRTTVWAHADLDYKNAQDRFRGCRRLFVIPDVDPKSNVVAPFGAEAVPRGFEKSLRHKVGVTAGAWCTTGLITLAWLLQEFECIHTVGWYADAATRDIMEFQRHYFGVQYARPSICHDIPAERRYFDYLRARGQVVELLTP